MERPGPLHQHRTKDMAPYASTTKVPVDQSRSEIERTLARYGATAFAYAAQDGEVAIMFEANGRRVRFRLNVLVKKPGENDASRKTREQDTRRRWRALLLCIKAKLESVNSRIETFEEAFLAHVVMPDGMTVGQHAIKGIEAAYSGRPMPPLLPGPGK